MIPDEVVDQVRDAADIVQVIGEYVNLKRAGTDFRGPCPFHQGTHRNFSVSPRKRMYYCFVCHEGGDVFRFLQKRLGMEWPAAVKMVGEKSGVEVREVDSRREGPDPREPLWEVNATAAAYFQKILWDDPLGESARDYLAQRDISREVAEQFGIGFAPREIGLLRNYMATLGFDEPRQVSAGLLVQGEDGSEPRPRFRGRLMFPILDSMGRNIGFGGRLLGAGEPKYLNSPESVAFSKGKTLYGLNWAKNDIRREDHVLVVEGYFDVVRLMTSGVTTVVAAMGTALTDWQSAALGKLTKNVFLLYDSDKAGLKATFRSGDELLRQGAAVRVVTLPDGEDPDSFVRKEGSAGVKRVLAESIDLFERKIQILERGGWFADLAKKRRALDRLTPTLRATIDPITRDLYVTRAHEVSGISREVLLREISGSLAVVQPTSSNAPTKPETKEPLAFPKRYEMPVIPPAFPGGSAERELIRVMLNARLYIDPLSEKLSPEDFWNPDFRAIYIALLKTPQAPIEALSQRLEESTVEQMQGLLGVAEGYDFDQTINDSLAKLYERSLLKERAKIARLTSVATDSEKNELIERRVALRDERREVSSPIKRESRKRRQ